MQNPPPLKNNSFLLLVHNNVQYSEQYEITIFRFLQFLVLEIWSLQLCRYALILFIVPKDVQWFVSQLRICRPPPLRSDHLDIKDAQYAELIMSVKLHITSYRVWALRAPKNSIFFNSSQICMVDWNWSDAHLTTLLPCHATTKSQFTVNFCKTQNRPKLKNYKESHKKTQE